MNSLVKNIIKSTMVYALIFSMVFSSFITGSSTSILNGLLEAHANNFVHGYPADAACGICSEAYENPPFKISLYRDKKAELPGTNGTYLLYEQMSGGIPEEDKLKGSFVLWAKMSDEGFGNRISETNTRWMEYSQASTHGMNRFGGGEPIGNALSILQAQNSLPFPNGVFYKELVENGEFKSKDQLLDYVNTFDKAGKKADASKALGYVFYSKGNVQGGGVTEFEIDKKFDDLFNPQKLDYGESDMWDESQVNEAWYRYLDFLLCCYAVAGTKTAEGEAKSDSDVWKSAIIDYINGETEDSPIAICLEPGCFGVWRANGTMWTEFMTAYDFLSTTATLLEQDRANSEAWWASYSGSEEFYDMFQAGYTHSDTPSLGGIDDALRHERTLKKSGSDLYSWGIGSIVKHRLELAWSPEGSINYNPANRTPSGYVENAALFDGTGRKVYGYTLWPAPSGQPAASFGALQATPDNYVLNTATIPTAVTLNLYGSVSEEDLGTWVNSINSAKASGRTFTVKVDWESTAANYGLTSKIVSNPYIEIWSPDTLLEWLTNRKTIVCYDALQGQVTNSTSTTIQYKANITITTENEFGTREYKGSASDVASFIIKLDRIGYTSTPEAYSEFKNFGVNSDFTGNLSEDFEAMAGVPSTEQLYFAAGGSEFIVDITLNEVNDETAYRTYDFYYSSVPCEHKDGDQADEDWTMPSAKGPGLDDCETNFNVHNGDVTVSASWSGTVKNIATPTSKTETKSAKHSVSASVEIPHKNDPADEKDYADACKARDEWVQAVKDEIIKHTSVSDDYTRETSIGAICSVSQDNNLTDAADSSDSQSQSAECNAKPAEGTPGQPGYVPAVPCTCSDLTVTASCTLGADGSWYVNATITIPQHAICGPCCEHDITEIHDTWRTSFTYDSMEINDVHVWRLDQGAIEGLEDIIGVDVVGADIVTEAPNIFYNIALKNDPNYKNLTYGEGYGGALATNHADVGRVWYHTYREEMDSVTICLGSRQNKCDGTSKTDGTNIHAAGGGGHAEVWGTNGFTYEYAVNSWSAAERVGSSHKGEIDNTLNPGGTIALNPTTGAYTATVGVHELNEKTDQYDKTTPEYRGFLTERDRKSGVTMVTDFLILQTTGGDQSVMYYEQSASSSFNQDSEYNPVSAGGFNPNYAYGEVGGSIANTMWYGNGLSAANWDPYQIYVGSYNGNYADPASKFGQAQQLGQIATSFDGAYNEANMIMQDRPLRPTHKLMIYEGDLNIELNNKNEVYYTGYAEAFWSNQLHWSNINYKRSLGGGTEGYPYRNTLTQKGMFTSTAPYSTSDFQFKGAENSGYVYDNGSTLVDSTKKYLDAIAEDFGTGDLETDEKNLGISGHQFGLSDFQEHGGFILEAIYSDGYAKTNDIIIYNPVSTQDTQLITLPKYRDQRTPESVKGGAAEIIDKISASQVCPEEPGLCDYRTLNCKFYTNQDIFKADFDTQINGNFVNLASEKHTADGTIYYDEYTVPTGMSLDRVGSSIALRAFATRLSIPFVDLGLTYSASTKIKVNADIILEPNGSDQMIFSFNEYGLYLPAVDENGQDSNRFIYFTTGNGMERKVSIPLADGERHHIEVVFSMSSLDYCSVKIDGKEATLKAINSSNTINAAKVGRYFNIGCWNKNSNYRAAFYLDNLVIERMAGSTEHTDECYTREMTHANALNSHRHTANCLALTETSTPVKEEFDYTGDAQIFTIPSDGFYKLETWGAQGGGAAVTLGSHGGYGGYTSGTAFFRKGEKLYVYVGGQGTQAASGQYGGAGYNGGGFGASTGFGGGGMTHISTSQNPVYNKLQELIVTNSGSQTFNYTGGIQKFTAPESGYYTFELYGAQGGKDTYAGGLGGKTTGTLYMSKGSFIYVVVGGMGASAATGTGGGYNGGGDAGPSGSSGAGGGATHIAIMSGTLASLKNSSHMVYAVAGGGGGGGNSYAGITGGAGGGETHNAPDGSYEADYKFGEGQDRAETKGNLDGGGGGGGYYGGYASYGDGGGAGGTGYINTQYITNGSTTSGVNEGNGKVVVTWNIYRDNSAYSESWDYRGTLMVAGGGGGADNMGGSIGDGDDGSGGHGGGLTAQAAFIAGAIQSRVATQSSGYKHGIGQSATTITDTGGAGGGWYGGYATNHNNGGAGGGSSYVLGYTGVNKTEITDLDTLNRQFKDVVMQQGVKSGNGYAKITKVGSVLDEVIDSMNGNGALPEEELQKYFGDAYEYLKKEDPVTILKSYSDFKNDSNGLYSLQSSGRPDVTANDDGSVTVGGLSGYEAALSTAIEAGAMKSIEVIFKSGSKTDGCGVQLNKSQYISGTRSTNANGDIIYTMDVSSYADSVEITDIYFDFDSGAGSGYSTIKQINIKGFGTVSTEIREYDVASGGLIYDTVDLWANPYGASTYRITLTGGAGGDARVVNTTNVLEKSGGAGATITGKAPIPAGAAIAITVGGKGENQEALTSISQGNRVTFNYNGSEQSYTAPADGTYFIEAYGASGGGAVIGEGASHGGKGGYTAGYVDLKKGDKLYIYVGGQGTQSNGIGTGGGYNGGGHGGPAGYGGGGMTHVSTTRNPAIASVGVTSKPAEPTYFEGQVKVNGVGTYHVMDFVSPVTGTMDLTFYCSNGHLTGYYILDSLGNKTDTGNVHGGVYTEQYVPMKNVSLIQGATYSLYLYSTCSNFAAPTAVNGSRETTVTASFSTNGGITESYVASGSWNPEGTLLVAGGGGGADNAGGTENGGDDGSGGYGGGTSGEYAKINGKYAPAQVTTYTLTNKLSARSGTEKSGSSAITDASGEGVYGPYVPYLAGQNVKVTVKGSNLTIGTPIIYTCYGHINLTNTITNLNKTSTQVTYEFLVPDRLTCNGCGNNCDPYSIWEFCYHQTGSGTMTIDSITLDNGGGSGSGLPGTQSSGFKQGVGESATSSASGYFDVGGAGAGWYGGYTTNHGNGGGAGGSGYINTSKVSYGTTSGNNRSGNGIVYITEPLSSRPSNADGEGGFNGGGAGGIEFGEYSGESSAGGGGMTDMKVNGSYFAIAAGGGGAGSHLAAKYGGMVSKTAYGKTWARVLYQDISANTNYFTTSTMGSVDQEGLYSCLDRLEDFRAADGTFEFMLEYPDSVYYSGTPNIWKQKSNPYTEQKTNGTDTGADATGFEAISYPMSASGYGGGLEYNGGSCVLDGAVNHGNWWLCVGIMNASYSPTNGDHGRAYTMPGPVGASGSEGVSKVALWVRIDNTNLELNGGNGSATGGDAGTFYTDGQSTNSYTAGGTQDSGYRNEYGIGVGQDGQNGVRSLNYGTVGGGGAGWYGGAQIKEYKSGEAMGGAGGSSYKATKWTEEDSYATNHEDGSFDLNEFRETLIVKKGNYDSGITTEVIMKYYTLIPDYLPDGTANPLWAHCNEKNNVHVCDEGCQMVEILTCTEPHHKNSHYNVNNDICWDACCDDSKHKTLASGTSVGNNNNNAANNEAGNFINLDYGFELFFPNRAKLDDGETYGIGGLSSARGKGYTDIYEADDSYENFKNNYMNIGCCSVLNGFVDNAEEHVYSRGVTPQLEPGTNDNYLGVGVGMNTTKWTRTKKVKFDVDVIYDPTPKSDGSYSENAKLYLANEWIFLGDRGVYKGAIGGIGSEADTGRYDETAWSNYGTWKYDGIYKDRYQFYCVMENSEHKAASYVIEVTSLNSDNFDLSGFGQESDGNEVTNKDRSSSFSSKHGAQNKNYYDVVGRIGNLVLEDTEDFRYSNLFKQTVEQLDSTGTVKVDVFYVGNGLVLGDSANTDNGAYINGDYIVTGATGQFAAVKGYAATKNFYKVEVLGKSLTAGRLAIMNNDGGYTPISDELYTNIQYSAEKVSYYVDLTGLVNESTSVDIKYIAKASNTMVVERITVSKLGQSPDGWILDGIVQEVDSSKQNAYLTWVADIRGIELSAKTRWVNTWGAIEWAEQADVLQLPLSPEKNNIDILKDEPMLVGYNSLFDIQTLGTYWDDRSSSLQIIPYYWAIDNDTGELLKLDVYMQHDGAYEPINIWGNVKKTDDDPIRNEIYNDIVNLDWDNEKDRRNFTSNANDSGDIVWADSVSSFEDLGLDSTGANSFLDTNDPDVSEYFRTLAVYIQSLPSRQALGDVAAGGEFGADGGTVPDVESMVTANRPVVIPGGHIDTLGNRQYLELNGRARTFVGGISTYDKLQDLGGRIMDYLWYRNAQRWHFTVGLPSASVFVEHGKDVTLSEIKRIQEDGYTIICTLNITAVGSVYALSYKHLYDGTVEDSDYPFYDTGSGGTNMGSIGIIERDKNGNITLSKTISLNQYAAELNYDPIVFVYNPGIDSGQDVEIKGTH